MGDLVESYAVRLQPNGIIRKDGIIIGSICEHGEGLRSKYDKAISALNKIYLGEVCYEEESPCNFHFQDKAEETLKELGEL